MSFAISGSLITQSGTDASLAGLSSVAGVTVTTFGASANAQKKYYTLPAGASLAYNNLTIDPKVECLVLGSGTAMMYPSSSSSVLTVGTQISQNSAVYGASGEAIISQSDGGVGWIVTTGLKLNQGTLNWYYGTIRVQSCTGIGATDYQTNGTLTGYVGPSAVLEVLYPATGSPTDASQIMIGGAVGFQVDGLTVRSYGSTAPSALVSLTTNQAWTYPPALTLEGVGGLSIQTASKASSMLNLYGFKTKGFWKGLNYFSGSLTRAVNCAAGSATPVSPHNSAVNVGQQYGYVEIRNEYTPTVRDSAGNPLPGVVIYCRDTNNGKRKSYTRNSNNYNNTADKVYIQSTNASGVAAFTGTANSILLCAVAVTVDNVTATADDQAGVNDKDYRSVSGTKGADDFRFHYWGYASAYQVFTETVKSDKVAFAPLKIVPLDSFVRLGEAAAVAKLASSFTVVTAGGAMPPGTDPGLITVTASSTLNDLYDALKAWKTRPVQAQLEFPAIGTQPVTASGTTVSTSMPMVVNAGVTLSAGPVADTLAASGGLTVNGTLGSGVKVTGNVTQPTPVSMSGVTITGNLTFNTNTDTTITLTGCTITGTISNSGTGTVTVTLAGGSTVGTVGTRVATRPATALTLTGLTAGSSILVTDSTGTQQAYVPSSSTSYTLDTTGGTGTWTWKVARYGSLAQSGTFTPAVASASAVVLLLPDTGITQATAATVAAYTTIGTPDRLYDYAAYWETTAAGIATARVAVKSGAVVDLGNRDIEFNTTPGVFSVYSDYIVVATPQVAGEAWRAGVTFAGVITNGIVNHYGLPGAMLLLSKGHHIGVANPLPAATVLDTSNGPVIVDYLQSSAGQVFAWDSAVTVQGAGALTVSSGTPGITVQVGAAVQSKITADTGVTVALLRGTLTFTGLAAGARVCVYNGGVMSETAVAAGPTVALATTYEVGTALTWRVFGAGKNPAAGTITVTAAGANTVPVGLTSADGLTTGALARAINGSTVNPAGQVSVDTTAKTITFHTAVDIRAALSAIQGAWATQSALYSLDIPIPFTLESVSGLLIRNDWTLVNPDTSTGEGYAMVNPATGAATQVNLDFISKGNTADVKVGLIYDGTAQPTTTMPGELDYLFIDVDPTPSTIQVNALIKRQDIVFIDRTETLRTGGVWGRFFRNAQTSFAQTVDATVTALLPADTTKYRLVQAPFTPPVDNNGVAHTFARVIEVQTGTTSRADLINQLAAVATFDDHYRAKPYSVNAAGKIVMETGTWVRHRDGTALTGNAAALFTFTSTAGEYVQPETRLLSIALDERAIRGCQYVVYRKATGAVLTDASGLEVTGTLTTANRSALITVQSSTDIDLIVATVGTGVAEGYAPVTLTSGTSTVTVATAAITVITPDPTQTINDPATGVLAWHPIIDAAIFDPDAKDIIIPTQTVDGQVVKSYNLAYFYMAWRKWITADVRRMRHGWAVYSEHQLAPPGAADLAYKFTPGTVFNDGWALNVPASRATSDIVRLEASLIGRRDTAANSGLVYRSPLANGATTMAEVVISGAATEVIRNAYNQTVANAKEIARLKNSLGWLIRGGKLLGIKPMPAAYSKTTDYTGEV